MQWGSLTFDAGDPMTSCAGPVMVLTAGANVAFKRPTSFGDTGAEAGLASCCQRTAVIAKELLTVCVSYCSGSWPLAMCIRECVKACIEHTILKTFHVWWQHPEDDFMQPHSKIVRRQTVIL